MSRAARRKHARAVERAVARTDDMMRELSRDVQAAIASVGDRPLTANDMAPLMLKVDRALAKVYGPQEGSLSPLERRISQEAAQTASEAISAVLLPFRALIAKEEPALAAQIDAEARRRLAGEKKRG